MNHYAYPRYGTEDIADVFELSHGEMAVTEIVVSASGYSWRQWCPWPEELFWSE